ncbi:MAG: hypothetical protein KKD01_14915 [Proteobacteria bacterium]|nr:hypothetical protein [Pseudomonadota bacterium]MBU1417408.1 hypothetical protein [Pseudomonadota bacterium]MBU1456013.1 hypothetical protein [Pseudomonadota bacterium]
MQAGRSPFLDVPFVPDEDYTAFLADHLEFLHSLHFSLYTSYGLDGRHSFDCHEVGHLCQLLSLLPGPGKYVLCNNRFLHPALYSDKKFLADLVSRLQTLLAEGCLQGLVFNDYYFLQALGDFSPETATCLEAVPGVNSLLQSYTKIHNRLLHIEATPFRLPTRIVLDRSLNRSPDLLLNLVQECRQAWPDLHLELLANEGCILHCPFKLTHDAHIGLANTGLVGEQNFRLNSMLGCIRFLRDQPARIFQSPFIRPEDSAYYLGLVDVLKLCGRTLGPSFLQPVIEAYCQGRQQGNLLQLFDTTEWLARTLYVDNSRIPEGFREHLSRCGQNCATCSYCRELLVKTGRDLPLEIPDFRE